MAMTDPSSASIIASELWRDLGDIVTAHVVMLRDTGIVDDPVLAALLTAIDGVSRGAQEADKDGIVGLIARFDERVDALTPAGAVGTGTVGRGRADTAAALVRLALRWDALALGQSVVGLRRTLIDLAGQHAATTMPAVSSGRPAQATTFGHFLGGVISPLGRATTRLNAAIDDLNRGPLGAVALASSSLPIDRERAAELLGFDSPVDNTFDAVIAVDHLVAVGQAASAVALPIRRLLVELGLWLRTDPSSLRLDDRWTRRDPGLPQLASPVGLDRIVAAASAAISHAAAGGRVADSLGYEPVGPELDVIFISTLTSVRDATGMVDATDALLREGLDVNRAYLANMAGRGHTTSSDLAIFLMEAEGLDPAAAANIAAMTINRAIADEIEASGITTQMIDASALLVIGRELAVEFEAISRYLAPRRFLERRTATGSPSPARTREYLGREERLLDEQHAWLGSLERRIAAASSERDRIVRDALAE